MNTRNDISAVITVADNTTVTPEVSVQFYGRSETALAEAVTFHWFLTTDAGAQTLCTDSTDTSEIAIKTNGTILVEDVADVMGVAVSKATGLADFVVTVVTEKQAVFNVVMPNGKLAQSDVMTYTAE